MNLSGVIGSLATGTYTVTRPTAAGNLSNGRYTAASTSTFSVQAAIMPVKGRDLQRLPEEFRTIGSIMIYCATELRTATAPAGVMADLISYQGETFEVTTVEKWNEAGGFYRCLAVKVGQ